MSEVEGEEAEVQGGKGVGGRPVGALDKKKRKREKKKRKPYAPRRCGDCLRAERAGAAECEGRWPKAKCPLGECPKAKKRKVR